MKKALLLTTLILSAFISNACIKHTDLKPDSTIKMDGTTMFGQGGGVDFDNDGNIDCSFTWYWFSGGMGFGGWQMTINANDSTTKYIVTGKDTLQFGERIVTPLSQGKSIDATDNWAYSQFGCALADSTKLNFSGLGDKYIGVQFTINNKVHYGWILVSFDSSATNRQLDIKSFAYNTSPGLGIVAGDTGTAIDTIVVFGKGGQDTLINSNTLQMETTITPTAAYNKELEWKVDDTTLASISATGLLTAKKVGKVKVTVTDSCSGKTDDTTITIKPLPVGITKEKIMSSTTIKIYPNPVNDILYLEKESGINYKTAILHSIEGKQLKAYTFEQDNLEINMKELPSGLYFMVLVNTNTDLREVVRITKR
ncbi:MAG: Ig-like domain-containing protein [Flavipsychrobacter sp.]